MNNKTVALVAIVAVATILITAALVTQQADARRHHRSVHQSIAQSAIANGNGDAQNTASQVAGSNNAVVVTGNQN